MCDGVSTRRALCGVSSTEQAGVQQVKSGSWFYGKTLAVAGRLDRLDKTRWQPRNAKAEKVPGVAQSKLSLKPL